MANVVINFTIPFHLIKPYMQRMQYINTELKRGVKKLEQEGYELTDSERELLRFDIHTNNLIYQQLHDALQITDEAQSIRESFPQSVQDEVNDILKNMMKGNNE
jgi:hypothetical protein